MLEREQLARAAALVMVSEDEWVKSVTIALRRSGIDDCRLADRLGHAAYLQIFVPKLTDRLAREFTDEELIWLATRHQEGAAPAVDKRQRTWNAIPGMIRAVFEASW